MLKSVFLGAGMILAVITASAQTPTGGNSLNVDVANLRADLNLLTQQVGQLSLHVEQLSNANAALTNQATTSAQNFATIQQLNQAINDLSAAIKAGDSAVATRATQQIQALGNATNTALASMSSGQSQVQTQSGTSSASSSASTPAAGFNNNYPTNGISYTVQRGDSIGLIARKTGSRVADIVNANKLTDPSHIQVGQVLFIPGGK